VSTEEAQKGQNIFGVTGQLQSMQSLAHGTWFDASLNGSQVKCARSSPVFLLILVSVSTVSRLRGDRNRENSLNHKNHAKRPFHAPPNSWTSVQHTVNRGGEHASRICAE